MTRNLHEVVENYVPDIDDWMTAFLFKASLRYGTVEIFLYLLCAYPLRDRECILGVGFFLYYHKIASVVALAFRQRYPISETLIANTKAEHNSPIRELCSVCAIPRYECYHYGTPYVITRPHEQGDYALFVRPFNGGKLV